MIQYTDIHLEDLKNLSLKSFTQLLINDFYPFIYSEIHKMDTCLTILKSDYDTDLLEITLKKIYTEFDELFRKEKLVLFPFLIQLDEEHQQSENCAPFKNIKLHYTAMLSHIVKAETMTANYFVNSVNNDTLSCLQNTLQGMKNTLIEIQQIKEKYFYKPLKNCGGCSSIPNV